MSYGIPAHASDDLPIKTLQVTNNAMGIGYFPALYPDELLSSAVARYRIHTMASFDAHVNKELYGRPQFHTSAALPRGLKALHKLIEPFIGLSLKELVDQATLYPYYLALTNKEVSTRMLSKMLQKRAGQRGQHRIGGTEPSITRVKLCPYCLEEDITCFGEGYWHRTHQLGCVHFCDKHATELVEAIIPIGPRRSIPALTLQTQTRHYLPILSERSRQRLIEVSRLARQYLERSIIYDHSVSRNSPPKAFRNLYELGKHLNTAVIRRDYLNYFGEQSLEILNIPLNPNASLDYIRDIFNSRWTTTKRLAMELFHQEFVIPHSALVISRGYAQEKISSRAWKCQNPAAPHFGQPVITDVRLVKGFEKNGGIVFRCTCGYHFFIRSNTWNFRSEPTTKKVFEFGDIFIKTARDLASQGIRNSEIARRLKIAPNTVKNICDASYDLRLTRRHGIEEARFASRLKNTLYVAKKRGGLSDSSSDEAMAALIGEAAKKLLLKNPPTQATPSRILDLAGIGALRLFKKPYCLAAISAIQQHAETASAFRSRQLGSRCDTTGEPE